MRELLVVDDELDLLETLSYNLRGSGYAPVCARSGEEALDLAGRMAPSGAVLDIGLPGISGLDVCRELRARQHSATLPILMLSARDDVIDRVVALELGADDYVTKPFSVRELILRIDSLLQRSLDGAADRMPPAPDRERLSLGSIDLDVASRQCFVSGHELRLTQIEFDLLHTLMARAGRVQSRERLLADVWQLEANSETRTLDTHIKRLRSKLGPASRVIRTYRGVGYAAQAR